MSKYQSYVRMERMEKHSVELDIPVVNKKLLVVVGGSHGAGKSTLCKEILQKNSLEYITPEEIRQKTNKNLSYFQILRDLLTLVKEHIQTKKSFLLEHVMSGNYIRKVIKAAKKEEFSIVLIYINIESAQIAQKRIEQRQKPQLEDSKRFEKLESRLKESRYNFWYEYREHADYWILYDNSSSPFNKVASFEKTKGFSIEKNSLLKKFITQASLHS